MSAHTPWPWVAHNAGTSNRTGASVTDAMGRPVASCRAYPRTSEARALANANARLIAAAPDLLAALRDLLAEFDGSRPFDPPSIKAARAALAKATGGGT